MIPFQSQQNAPAILQQSIVDLAQIQTNTNSSKNPRHTGLRRLRSRRNRAYRQPRVGHHDQVNLGNQISLLGQVGIAIAKLARRKGAGRAVKELG